ncbi:hypothetical protein PAMA_007672 [Pampus argenteus]
MEMCLKPAESAGLLQSDHSGTHTGLTDTQTPITRSLRLPAVPGTPLLRQRGPTTLLFNPAVFTSTDGARHPGLNRHPPATVIQTFISAQQQQSTSLPRFRFPHLSQPPPESSRVTSRSFYGHRCIISVEHDFRLQEGQVVRTWKVGDPPEGSPQCTTPQPTTPHQQDSPQPVRPPATTKKNRKKCFWFL